MTAPLRADPANWAVAGLRAYVRWSAGRRFHGWHVGGTGLAAAQDRSLPVIFVANHTSWWDGFFALELAARLDQRFFVMMQADQLAAIPFFARAGAFSVDKQDARQAARDLAYAATLLAPGRGVWIFPQGRRRPAAAPIEVASGAAHLACGRGPVRVVPVALRYPFLSEELPEAFAWLGPPFEVHAGASVGDVRRRMGEALRSALAALDASLATTERAGFELLLAGAPSANRRVAAWKARWGLAPPEAVRNG